MDEGGSSGATMSMGAVVLMAVKFDQEFRDRFLAGQASELEIYEAMKDLIETGQLGSARGYYRRLAQTMLDGGWFNEQTNTER